MPQAGERETEKDRGNIGVEGGNAFIYIYGIVDDATRAYIRFEMHKERARGRGGGLISSGGIKMAATRSCKHTANATGNAKCI